jgi:toxin ParE1/3/4
MAEVLRRPQVLIDLAEQADFIAQDSLDAALRFLDAAETTFQFIAENPKIGRLCDFKRQEASRLRRWRIRGFENYLVFYRPTEIGIDVVRVLHGARDIETILGDAESDKQ